MDFNSALLGIFIGVAATITALIIFHFVIAPRLYFSKSIYVKQRYDPNHYVYSVAVKRVGLVSLIDMTFRARLSVLDVAKDGRAKKLWTYYTLKTSSSESLIFGGKERWVHIYLNESHLLDREQHPHLAKNLRTFGDKKQLQLEDIAASFEGGSIALYVLGHDRFTGVKKLYISPRYRVFNISRQDFDDACVQWIPSR